MHKRFLLLLAAALLSFPAMAADRPNVIIIYGDDVGYADVGAYGSKLIPTPNIDRLAKEGLLFTDGHCTAATCTPSRFSMLTGIYGFRKGIHILAPNARLTIPTDITTLPGVFRKAGYATAVVGKWHLGLGAAGQEVDWNGDVKPGPLEVGFDYSFLLPSTNDRVPCVYLENYRVVNLDAADPLYVGKLPEGANATLYPDGRKNPEAMTYYPSSHGHNHSVINGIGRIGTMFGGKSALWNDETMADEFVKQAEKWIGANKEKPFFLFFSSQDIHVPRTPHPRFQGKSKLGYRGDAMVQLDWSTGAIMDVLEKHDLADNTMIIFSSDNGPVYDDGYQDGTTLKPRTGEVDRGHDGSGPYRGGKYQIYEGGTRVPFIIRWPDGIKPGKSDALVSQIDFAASFAAMLDVPVADQELPDSRNTLDAFLGKSEKGAEWTLEEAGKSVAIRHGNWKFIDASGKKRGKGKPKEPAVQKGAPKGQLYNLTDDVGEQNNVIAEHPDKAQELQLLLKAAKESRGLRLMKETL